MNKFPVRRLDELVAQGVILLGRGDIISKDDISADPGPYPIYSSSANGDGKFGEYGKFMFDEELITWSVDGGGKFFYRKKHKYSVTNVCGYLRVRSPKLSPLFLYYVLADQHRYLTFDYTTKAHPSVIKKQYWVPDVDLRIQERVSEIIAGVDASIEQTRSLIEKYQQIKAGLMHDLFTRGVLPNGQLRPRREDAPELYKETALGFLPKEWEVTTCADICEKVIDCKNRTPPENVDGYPVIRTPNVRDGEFVDDCLVYTDIASYIEWTVRGQPMPGDIVITREAPVGEVCMIPDRHPKACLGQRMMLYRPDASKVFPRFFLHALQSQQVQNRLDLISGGSTVGHVRVGDIRNLWMFRPQSLKEQADIASSVDSVSDKLRKEKANLAKLQAQKTGLMQDLLTGKVPVPVPEHEATDG